ncbi:MAG TPA: hypothetical protein VF120_12365 [Ktedonobacterales bacterium]
MGLIVMDACQQTTCSFAQKLPLVYLIFVVVFGLPIAAILLHLAMRSWQSARLDLRERRLGKGRSTTLPSAYARLLWAASVAALCADWLYFTVANIVRQTNSKTTDLRFPSGSVPILVVCLLFWAVSLPTLAVLWKFRPREALPPMLKRAN